MCLLRFLYSLARSISTPVVVAAIGYGEHRCVWKLLDLIRSSCRRCSLFITVGGRRLPPFANWMMGQRSRFMFCLFSMLLITLCLLLRRLLLPLRAALCLRLLGRRRGSGFWPCGGRVLGWLGFCVFCAGVRGSGFFSLYAGIRVTLAHFTRRPCAGRHLLFFAAAKKSRQKKAAQTANSSSCPRALDVPTLHAVTHVFMFVANALYVRLTRFMRPRRSTPCQTTTRRPGGKLCVGRRAVCASLQTD